MEWWNGLDHGYVTGVWLRPTLERWKHGGEVLRTSISCSSSGTNLQLNRPRYHLFYSAASSVWKTRARDFCK